MSMRAGRADGLLAEHRVTIITTTALIPRKDTTMPVDRAETRQTKAFEHDMKTELQEVRARARVG